MLPPMIELLPVTGDWLSVAVERLRGGGLVAFPTETVYGLGADAADPAAVASVYRLKGRPSDHPLIVHLPAAAAVWSWADASAQARSGLAPDAVDALAGSLWPGPLTLVLWAAPSVPRAVTGGQDTVALRVPGNDTALALLTAFGRGVVAPSANRFGRVSPTQPTHVVDEFEDADGDVLVLEGGATDHGVESSVIDLTSATPRLLRPGALAVADIESVLGMAVERPGWRQGRETAPPGAATTTTRAPGTLAQHYAPATPLRLASAAHLTARPRGSAVIARFADPAETSPEGSREEAGPGATAPWIRLPADPAGFAHGLYAAIRHLDAAGADLILVEEPPTGDEWLAVRDRLMRAAAAHR